MRLCFIGDSHLGCIKRAWDATQAEATFFALPGKGIARLEMRDGALSSGNPEIAGYLSRVSGGRDCIDASYDAYALHAMNLGIGMAFATLRDLGGAGASAALVNTQDFRFALRGAIESSIAVTTLRKLRRITKAPAIVSPMPLVDTDFVPLRERLAERNATEALARLFVEECEAVCRSLGATFVPQPPETLTADGLATKAEYAKDAARFSDQSKEDRKHMNARYGAIVIAAMMAAL